MKKIDDDDDLRINKIRTQDILQEYVKINISTIYKWIIITLLVIIGLMIYGFMVYHNMNEIRLKKDQIIQESKAIEELMQVTSLDKSEIDGSILETITETNGVYLGERVNGKKEGQGKYTWNSGATYEGDFKDDKIEGNGTLFIPGNGTYTGEFVNNKKNGKGKYEFINGDEYHGEWVNDQFSGEGKYIFSNGDTYTGSFADNKFNGQGTYIHSGSRYSGTWINNVYKK